MKKVSQVICCRYEGMNLLGSSYAGPPRTAAGRLLNFCLVGLVVFGAYIYGPGEEGRITKVGPVERISQGTAIFKPANCHYAKVMGVNKIATVLSERGRIGTGKLLSNV